MDDNLRDILGHVVKCGGIGILEPSKLADRGHAMSVEACEAMVE